MTPPITSPLQIFLGPTGVLTPFIHYTFSQVMTRVTYRVTTLMTNTVDKGLDRVTNGPLFDRLLR